MTMTAPAPPPQKQPPAQPPVQDAAPPADEQHLLLHGVTWDFYLATLEQLERSGQRFRVTYDRGRMEVVTISYQHEMWKTDAARLVESYSAGARVPVYGRGQVTHLDVDRDLGLEPDECYYVQTPPPVMDEVRPLDLRRDPPPDLAIEIDVTRSSIPREPIYAALGVGEVWRYDGETAAFLHRQPNGTYQPSDRSRAFPALSASDFNRFLALARSQGQNDAAWAFEDWAREQKRAALE